MERIEVCVGEAEVGKDRDRSHLKEQQNHRNHAHQSDAKKIKKSDQYDKCERNHPVLKSVMYRQHTRYGVSQLHPVGACDEKCAGPIPPAALETPEIAEGGTRPSIKAPSTGIALDISAVARAIGTLNSSGMTRMKSNAIPGPEVETIASNPNGPPAQ